MGLIGRSLPGEFEAAIHPRPSQTAVSDEERLSAAAFYRRARFVGETVIPGLEGSLEDQPYDPELAEGLLQKHDALPSPYKCRFGRAGLEIDKGVFCPVLTNVSPFLRKHIDFRAGERVLDAFAGSGAFAINAALHGARAVAYDISPLATACASKNACKNGVSDKVDVRLGSLPEVLAPGEQFDLVIANPPLVPYDSDDSLKRALFDEGLDATQQFIATLPAILAPRGRCYLATSDVIDRKGYEVDITRLCHQSGLAIETIAWLHLRYESYRVHKIEHANVRTRLRPLLKRMLEFAG